MIWAYSGAVLRGTRPGGNPIFGPTSDSGGSRGSRVPDCGIQYDRPGNHGRMHGHNSSSSVASQNQSRCANVEQHLIVDPLHGIDRSLDHERDAVL